MDVFEAADGEIPLLTALPLMQRLLVLNHSKKRYGLSKTQLIVLYALRTRGAMRMSQIADYITASKEQATRTVAPLAEAGLVERSTPPDNRTHVYIGLTEEGRAYIERFFMDLSSSCRERLTASLTAEEQARLRDATLTIIELLRKVQ